MPPRLAAAFRLLGVDPRSWVRSRPIKSQEAADMLRDDMVAEALANFRRRIKTAHPDAGGSQERAQELNQAKDIVTKCRFHYQTPVTVPTTVVWIRPWSGTGTTSNSATRAPGPGI